MLQFPVAVVGKKRKIETSGGAGETEAWKPEDKQLQVFSELKKVLESKESSLQLAYAHHGHYHTVTAKGYHRVSVDALRKAIEKCGEHLADINVQFSAQGNATLAIQVVNEPTQVQRIPVQYVSRVTHEGGNESKLDSATSDPDSTMHKALEAYAKDYMLQDTPRDVQTTVQDKPAQSGWFGGRSTSKEFEMRVLGWQTATLQQLEEFRNMLPYHVTSVEFDSQRVFVSINTYTQPLRRVWFVAA